MTKFVASTVEMNKDTDIIAEDIRTASDIQVFLDEVLDRADNEVVYVVGEEMVTAQNVAAVFNTEYEKEMELMKDANMAKEEVDKVVEGAKKEKEEAVSEINTKAALRSKASAKKFLKEQSAKMLGAKKSPVKEEENKSAENTKEEETMKTNTTMGRRRLSTTVKSQEETTVQNNTKEEEVVNVNKRQGVKKEETTVKGGRRRLSTGAQTEVAAQTKVTGRKRLGRSESIKSEFKKFEGPWYLNSSMYDVLNRFEAIIEDMADAELGITDIVLVEPADIARYANRADILVVIQIKANGNVLEFPIKENTSTNSSSDLNSTSIGWIETKNGMRPSFGFYRPNALQVKVTCTCGNAFTANTGNVYCPKCKTRHDDFTVSANHKLDFDFDGEWVFQTVPNMVVPRETLALVMAIAQYDAGLDMHGLVEDAE